ncbi:MAG: mechanosensitive ion channel [candidate division Zixibacteria bacterium]|nr:mechanosensitive ion channel [candidate division Zixibacteria bacterium]
MEILTRFAQELYTFLPALIAVISVVIIIILTRFILNKRYSGSPGHQFRLQLIILLLSFAGLIIVILSLPISEGTTGQLLSLIGILLSAAIALSATTFVGNIMAGLMQRAVGSFRPGDFIRVGDYFGRVTDVGLFHVEIQTEDRDLTTMPNLYLATNPVKVIRSSGTLVTAEVSLGYDVPYPRIKECLLSAAGETELEDPFVHIIKLGDYSITYRIAGLLNDVKHLLSKRSQLKEKILDNLHGAGIEIVSPSFMNQRAVGDKVFIPEKPSSTTKEPEEHKPAEKIIFDKAEEAESIEKLRDRHGELQKEIEELKTQIGAEKEKEKRSRLEDQLNLSKKRAEQLSDYIKKKQTEDPPK